MTVESVRFESRNRRRPDGVWSNWLENTPSRRVVAILNQGVESVTLDFDDGSAVEWRRRRVKLTELEAGDSYVPDSGPHTDHTIEVTDTKHYAMSTGPDPVDRDEYLVTVCCRTCDLTWTFDAVAEEWYEEQMARDLGKGQR